MSALQSLSSVIPFLREDNITELVVPTLIKACGDKVPNVQFCASKIIKEHRKAFDANVLKDTIIPI